MSVGQYHGLAGLVGMRLCRLYTGRLEDVCVGNSTGWLDWLGRVNIGRIQAGWTV
jgi:hypothetical protein